MSGTKEKKLNLPQSLLLLLLIIVSVAVCIRLKTGGPMIGLFASWIFIYLFCKISVFLTPKLLPAHTMPSVWSSRRSAF